MSLVINGVIVPEDTANALTLNGVDTTSMFVNGVQVFNQQLFSATWSGDSLGNNNDGIETSGSNYRWVNSGNWFGNWLTATTSGLANGTSSSEGNYIFGLITTTTTTFRVYQFTNTNNSNWITWSLANGFSGFTSVYNDGTGWRFNTSGGAIRYWNDDFVNYGAWVTLN